MSLARYSRWGSKESDVTKTCHKNKELAKFYKQDSGSLRSFPQVVSARIGQKDNWNPNIYNFRSCIQNFHGEIELKCREEAYPLFAEGPGNWVLLDPGLRSSCTSSSPDRFLSI